MRRRVNSTAVQDSIVVCVECERAQSESHGQLAIVNRKSIIKTSEIHTHSLTHTAGWSASGRKKIAGSQSLQEVSVCDRDSWPKTAEGGAAPVAATAV